jgi:hypothetical protein
MRRTVAEFVDLAEPFEADGEPKLAVLGDGDVVAESSLVVHPSLPTPLKRTPST